MSRSYQNEISWGRSKSSKSHRQGHYDKIENEDSRDENGDYVARKSHWRADLQTVQDYKNWIFGMMSNPAMVTDMFSRRRWQEFHEFCKSKFDGEMSEQAVDEFALAQWKKDRSK